jgi:rhomboid protease GluP
MRGGTTAFGKRGGSRLMATAAVSAGPAMASTAIAEEIPDDPPGTGIRWPLLSIAILIVLVIVFWAEQHFPISPGHGTEPSLRTIIALGAVSRDLVAQGEWWRIFTAPLMHGDISHIVGNGIALFFAARFLEMIAGRAWLAALFTLGALAGVAASLAMNPPELVTIGASGAIMGLLAALFVLSFDNQVVKNTARMQRWTLFLLIPSLLPAAAGSNIDVSAHLGGAIAGALAGFFLQATWSETRGTPNYQGAAAVVGIGGVAAAALSFALVASHFSISAAHAADIPEMRVMSADDYPNDPAEADKKSAEYVRQFPDDPRAHFFRALFFMKNMDMTSAQSEIRTALDEKKVLDALPLSFTSTLQIMLAATLVQQGRMEDARREAAPACASGDVMSSLDSIMSELKDEGICPKDG